MLRNLMHVSLGSHSSIMYPLIVFGKWLSYNAATISVTHMKFACCHCSNYLVINLTILKVMC